MFLHIVHSSIGRRNHHSTVAQIHLTIYCCIPEVVFGVQQCQCPLVQKDFLIYTNFQFLQHLGHTLRGVYNFKLSIIGHINLDGFLVGIDALNQLFNKICPLLHIESRHIPSECNAVHGKLMILDTLQNCLGVGSLNRHPNSLFQFPFCFFRFRLRRNGIYSINGVFMSFFRCHRIFLQHLCNHGFPDFSHRCRWHLHGLGRCLRLP